MIMPREETNISQKGIVREVQPNINMLLKFGQFYYTQGFNNFDDEF